MGRKKIFQVEEIQKGLCGLLKREGFGNFSMQLVAKELEIPIGSLYHRYPSKIDMVADLWLSIIQSFQFEFHNSLKKKKDPKLAGREAALQVARWMEQKPEFAYLLSFVRKEDLNHSEWNPHYLSLEKKLNLEMKRMWAQWSQQLSQTKLDDSELFVLKSIIVEIPIQVCKPFIGKKFPDYLFQFIEQTYKWHIEKFQKNK